mgnify:CR=1 FL=1
MDKGYAMKFAVQIANTILANPAFSVANQLTDDDSATDVATSVACFIKTLTEKLVEIH